MKNKLALLIAGTLVAMGPISDTPASGAVPRHAEPDLDVTVCEPTADSLNPECMFYVAAPTATQDPRVSAVVTALNAGAIEEAQAFVEENSDEWPPAVTDSAETKIDAAESDARKGIHRHWGASGRAVYAKSVTSAYSDVTTLAKDYGYCASTCQLVGKVRIEMRTNINLGIVLSGDARATAGPAIAILGADCRIRYERSFSPDTTVYTWPNCNQVESSSLYSSWIQIQGKLSGFLGTNGASYHNDFSFRVDPLGAPPEMVLSDKTATWKYPSGGGTPRFPT